MAKENKRQGEESGVGERDSERKQTPGHKQKKKKKKKWGGAEKECGRKQTPTEAGSAEN